MPCKYTKAKAKAIPIEIVFVFPAISCPLTLSFTCTTCLQHRIHDWMVSVWFVCAAVIYFIFKLSVIYNLLEILTPSMSPSGLIFSRVQRSACRRSISRTVHSETRSDNLIMFKKVQGSYSTIRSIPNRLTFERSAHCFLCSVMR